MSFRQEAAQSSNLTKIVCSNPFLKTADYQKITLRPIIQNNGRVFHVEKLTKTQAFHENVSEEDVEKWLLDNVSGIYKQVSLFLTDKNITYLFSKNGEKRLESRANNVVQEQGFNREKNYLLAEGDNIPAFVDLGIFTREFRVVRQKYDKYKQINRFVELLDDAFKNYDKDSVTLLDFGCGKSYLTFFIYYYFAQIKKVNVKIIGYDLKSDVVKHCNAIAQKYGYANLHFVVADVSKDVLCDEPVDAVVSLHACDTATDYALNYAIKKGAKYIFSVPCCQHEVNLSIKKGGDLDVFLKYGIVKERVSALLTDTIRAMILQDEGYSVDVLEFVDLAHSPINLMIRAIKTHGKNSKNKVEIESLMAKYGFEQTLYKLTN